MDLNALLNMGSAYLKDNPDAVKSALAGAQQHFSKNPEALGSLIDQAAAQLGVSAEHAKIAKDAATAHLAPKPAGEATAPAAVEAAAAAPAEAAAEAKPAE